MFVAVPLFGIEEQGLGGYLKTYIEPTIIMLPFNIISELSRTLALAVRLFGNMMSGAMIVGILLTITPFIFPDHHDRARSSDRHGAGLHLQHPGGGLHRGRHARRASQSATAPDLNATNQRNHYGQHDSHRNRFDRHRRLHHRHRLHGPALGEGRAVATALTSLAQQPDASATITRTLFVGLAMIESMAIYCFVVSMILIFANPFWNHVIAQAGGK